MPSLRHIAEVVCRRVVLKRKLPSRMGGAPIYVSPDSALSLWRWDMDKVKSLRALFDWVEEFVKAGDVVWDIGANVGVFTFAAANRAGTDGRIVAIEPDVFLADLLQRSAGLRSKPRATISILPMAVSDSVDLVEFCISKRGRASSHLRTVAGSSQTWGARAIVWALTVTRDWLAERLPVPQVLKVDVETAEHLVLQGGAELICTHKPIILCEVSYEQGDAVTDLLHAYGYVLYDLAGRDKGKTARAPHNTLALPKGAG